MNIQIKIRPDRCGPGDKLWEISVNGKLAGEVSRDQGCVVFEAILNEMDGSAIASQRWIGNHPNADRAMAQVIFHLIRHSPIN